MPPKDRSGLQTGLPIVFTKGVDPVRGFKVIFLSSLE